MLHTFVFQPVSKIARDVAGSVVAQQSWLVDDVNLVTSRRRQSQVQRVGDILSPHVRAKLPRDDVAAVIIEDCAEIVQAPLDDLEVGEVGLPKLIDGRRLVFELVGRLNHNEGGTGDQIVRFQDPIRRSL